MRLYGGGVFSGLKKARQDGLRAGIVLGDGSLALAVVRRPADGKPELVESLRQPLGADIQTSLRATLDKLGLKRTRTCAVLDSADYQVVQVEAPEVLPSELRAAIRWRLRDAIGFSVDEAAIDIFEIPEPARRTPQKMLFAVAARDTAVQRVVSALKPAARGFDAIDVPELCLRNVAALLPQDQKGVAVLALNEQFVQLVITRQNVLYVTRRIDLRRGLSLDGDSSIDASALALELQRSLDYYESHFDQTPIGDLIIAPPHAQAESLATALRAEVSLRISLLDVREHCVVARSGEILSDWPSLMALGAALRQDAPGQ
jgi:MSHA biogenesis protein MshI